MKLSFFNTMGRRVEDFQSLQPDTIGMYTCGPTVYDYAHIGNFRAYVVEDLMRRFLKYSGFKVIHVMNITDIDDKIIKSSLNEGIPIGQFTKKYIDAFFEDIDRLNVERAEYYPKATEHIPEMISIIKDLMAKEIAYKGEDGSIYFSISKDEDYGKLANLDMSELKTGVRIKHDEYDKESASDFALWKAWDEADGEVFWKTELGKGRPGWHIECSAMSMKYLGEQIDIHMGGVDNIFPHHENEIAQSESYTGKKFVNYWIHCEHLLSDHKKMSKSLGNFYTLRDLIEKGFSPVALRYLYISTHYRSKLNFTIEALKAAQNTVNGLKEFIDGLSHLPDKANSNDNIDNLVIKTKKEFDDKMADDLNTPQAFAALFNLITEINKIINKNELNKNDGKKIEQFFLKIDEVMGLNLIAKTGKDDLSEEEMKLIKDREDARKNRDFKKSDEIRDLLKTRGIIIKDTPSGAVWTKNQIS